MKKKHILKRKLLILLFIFISAVVNAQSDSIKNSEKNMDEMHRIETYVEEMPVFPGGDEGMKKYLTKNLKYPIEAREEGITGKVTVGFLVDERGKVVDVQIAKSDNELLNKEAIRLVEEMPDWTPGKRNGIPTRVSFKMPIYFNLVDKKN